MGCAEPSISEVGGKEQPEALTSDCRAQVAPCASEEVGVLQLLHHQKKIISCPHIAPDPSQADLVLCCPPG